MSCGTSILGLPIKDLDHVFDAVGSRWERLRGHRILLTGGTGFIGKWLLASFLYANRRLGLSAHIALLSRNPEIFLNTFPELVGAGEVEWLFGDVRNLKPEDVQNCSFAIHAATDVAGASSASDVLDTCITGTGRVLDALSVGETPRRMLLLSSGAVYGRTMPDASAISEEWSGAPDPLEPTSAYGEGKRVSELLGAMTASRRPGLEVAIARCFAFVGPHLPFNKHFAIGNFISSGMCGKDIHIQGDGTPLRSYLYAADLAHWLWVMLFDAPSGRAYNIGGDERLSIAELAHRVNYVLGSKGKVFIAQQPRNGVIPQAYIPSIDRIANELGLIPTVGLDDAILRTANWAERFLVI